MSALPDTGFEGKPPQPVPICWPLDPSELDARLDFHEPGEPPLPARPDEIERLADALREHLAWLAAAVNGKAKRPAEALGLRTAAWLLALSPALLGGTSQANTAKRLGVSKQRLGQAIKAARRLVNDQRRHK